MERKTLYPFIELRNGELYIEELPALEIAEKFSTPAYVYSANAFRWWFNEFNSAFSQVEHTTCFAVKANSNVWVLKLLAELGAGADTVSAGEIHRALTAGISPKKIVFAGVGKRPDEIEFALERDILMINVESESELETVNRVGEKLGKKAPIALRVNPEVDPKTHPYISTGLHEAKFGVDYERAVELYKKAKEMKWVNPVGIHFHIGSQITDTSAFGEAAEKVAELVKELHSLGIEVELFDAGGGLGVNYNPQEPPVPSEELAKQLIPAVKELGCKLILEPGRRISANAGVLLTKLLYIKRRPNKTFYIVDAGMNDLARPALYGAYHHIVPVVNKGRKTETVDVVGPICETGDILAKGRELPECSEGDILAVLSAGAYGFTMASNYNSRPRPPEILVEGSSTRVIRQRETISDLLAREF
ncbi:diaminopimelate decarboxylase [Thermovibrio ammonificans HB-1]|uniref:Diaminopimelate decarboxylase n=1 Tax=Thermovibrio ammonificans (strain DSM 15698 / JCM 12110 / HB-1) TaxID=648996 RepID=E8T618_THEA1|nr:diaminopimelate decarboxylase [Thermovibrio ammonificans]ADU96602.1 diaminopimelate decarboxylase [Thermovibrio ammonificans HB-1]